jgi:hypothetical protein
VLFRVSRGGLNLGAAFWTLTFFHVSLLAERVGSEKGNYFIWLNNCFGADRSLLV